MIPGRYFESRTCNYVIEHGAILRSSSFSRDLLDGERRLGAFTLPPFQRPSVWTEAQKVRFVESIWLNLPIASYVINRDDQDFLGYPCDEWLLDGQQRWTAILDYVSDRLRVFDLRFSEITEGERRRFMVHPFPAIETRNLTARQCQDIYNRLAYGGTNH